jgi:GDP-mannose transporter
MVGALNKLPVAASGMIFFGDAVTFGSVSAIGVGFFAGLLYAVAKNNQKKAEAAAQNNVLPMSTRSS